MTELRLLADDLTGAMDTAAQFVGLTGPVTVRWDDVDAAAPASVAVDCGTREGDDDMAAAAIARWAPLLRPADGRLSYLKLDSLLRGHAGREIAGCLAGGAFRHCLVAPAFPFQGRVTRHGRQWARFDAGWSRVGEDIAAMLAGLGRPVARARPGDPVPPGISLWDAETEDDLDIIAAAGRALGPAVLWCGSGGLAGALSRGRQNGGKQTSILPRPLLGLFGTNHPVTAAQLDAAGALTIRVSDGAAAAHTVHRRLDEQGALLAAFDPPPGLSRRDAAAWIGRELTVMTRRLDAPACLVVGGGETVRSLCRALGTTSIEVTGQIMPGVPRAILRGGCWNGTELITKSGAFGEADLLLRLTTDPHPQQIARSSPTTETFSQGQTP